MKHDAPRLRAYLDKNGYIFMSRSDWEEIKNFSTEFQIIRIENTPLFKLTKNPNFILADQIRMSETEYKVRIFRIDRKDSKPINVDFYQIQEDLQGHNYELNRNDVTISKDFPQLVQTCSTSLDTNMEGFLEEYVVLFPLPKGEGHWLSVEECPIDVQVEVKKERKFE